MKVVIDTNVLVAAILSDSGANREVIRCSLRRRIVPQMGTTLFLEHEDVFERGPVLHRCKLTLAEREIFLDAYLSVCQWNELYFTWRPNLKDEGDNHIVELAVASGSRYIVTNNIRDFKASELHFRGLEIIQPSQLLEVLR